MARKFLYLVAFLIVLAVAGALVMRYWALELTEFAYVPRGEFKPQDPLAGNAYDDLAMWFSRPGIGAGDPARWKPEGWVEQPGSAEPFRNAAVFFIHPTSYLDRDQWNAPLDDRPSQARARLFIRGMASPFAAAREIWIPRYRQAAFGAFLTDAPEAAQAIDAAYADVAQAFDYFLAGVPKDSPIVLVGHSQGALHLLRLLRQKIAGTPLQSRIAAAYPIGWPISLEHDLPALGLPACATAGQPQCIVSWSSFAEPADASSIRKGYAITTGFDGRPRGDTPILCTNPLTGMLGGAAPASANLGTLVPDKTLTSGTIMPGLVPARCEDGLLLIGPPPELGPYVLPGNNYHLYDILLFWANLRADAAARLAAWRPAR